MTTPIWAEGDVLTARDLNAQFAAADERMDAIALTGKTYVDDTVGGGNLATSWTTSTKPARLYLPVGVYLVVVKCGMLLSLAANTSTEVHLFNAAGQPFGSGQSFQRQIASAAQAGVQTYTAEFTRIITVTNAASPVEARARAIDAGGVQQFGPQMLSAVRLH